jgi:hypothetical protein
MPDDPVVHALRSARLAMNAVDDGVTRSLGSRWLQLESQLSGNIAALSNEMVRRREAGEVVTDTMVRRSERYAIMRAQLQNETDKFNRDTLRDISDGQENAIRLGVSAAENALIVSLPKAGSFRKVNIKAIRKMIGIAGDGSPLMKLLKKSYGDALIGITRALLRGVSRGLGADEVARLMVKGAGMGMDRALVIARTELNRVYRLASTETYRESGIVEGWMRLCARDEACFSCIVLDGERFDSADEMDDHPNGRAEFPDNLILTDSPTALETFWHNDYIFIIRTASGKQLTVTANHPVLTDRGWVAAAFIHKGDNVISAGGSDWASRFASPDDNNVPTFAKNLADAFDMVRLGRVPKSAKHLYRNGEGGEIDVVFINRHLWDGYNSTFRQQLREYFSAGGMFGSFFSTPLARFKRCSIVCSVPRTES